MLELLNFSGKKKLPIILQAEATECGLASLAMIAKYHGHDVDLNGLRQRFPISLKGAALETLIDLSGKLDLGARALRVDFEALPNVITPAILHWDLNHFVVLKQIKGNKAYIHDPAYGLRMMKLEDVSDHFTGVVLELSPTSDFQKQKARNTMRLSQLWDRLVGWKRAIIQLLFLSFVLQLISLTSPFYLQLVVDEAIVKFDTKLLLVLASAFLGLAIIQNLTSLMRGWTVLFFSNQLSFQMVANLFKHLMHLPADYFEKRHIGDILSRMGSTSPIQTALTESVVAGIIDGIMAIITGIVIFIYSPLLGAIVLVSVIINFAITLAYYPVLRRKQEEMIITAAKENTHMIESVRASTTIKLFNAQNQRLSIWRNLMADTINTGISYGKYELVMGSIQGLVSAIQSVLVVYFGAKLILSGSNQFTVGMLFAFMSYRGNFTSAVNSLFSKVIEFRLLNLHLDRIADIAQAKPEFTSFAESNLSEAAIKGKIELRNVRFRYSPSDPWILDDVSLVINPQDFVAFIGPSGGGKTTLLKLILGLYAPTEGEILIDGHPLTDDNRTKWRQSMGVVMQDDQLLSGTIADNISFFDPNLDMERVYEVAKQASIHDEIMAMPMKYLSLMGDMGSALSGGQRQRVLLARAFYREPIILCLDEGTANIDEQTEIKIVDIIKNSSLTRLVVAHRPEFINQADRLCVVSEQTVQEYSKER